ncbi:MAG: hypothetical protein GF353_27140 [Candidatus Lokiarchaeota archaeon]|nr:hypothetical protein [Candidatus Lokiarchaeota archaeon]
MGNEIEKEDNIKETTLAEKDVLKEDINLQIHWYLIAFFSMYYGSYFVPATLFLMYLLVFLIPNVMEQTRFVNLFIDPKSLTILVLTPVVAILCYLIRLMLLAMITRWLWGITEKKVPTKDGVIPRNIRSKTLNFYHIRSFMIKYPKYVFTKGIFPWLANWMYNFVGSNKIGKGTTIEEQVCADKYIDVGDNCYIGVNSVLTSHLVEGIFGNISYFKLSVGDNVTYAGMNNYASGCKIGDNSFLMPWASGGKHYTVSGGDFYSGLPLRKVFKKKLEKYLKIPQHILLEEKKYRKGSGDLGSFKEVLKQYNEKHSEPLKKSRRDRKKSKIKATQEIPESTQFMQNHKEDKEKPDLSLNFTTSSAISNVSIKFLALYIPILWLCGLAVIIYWYDFTRTKSPFLLNPLEWLPLFLFLPIAIISMHIIFVAASILVTRLFLTLINLIHQPKQGIFQATKGNRDFDFWCLRTELKKMALSFTRNFPLPYIDAWALGWLGISMDFSSHLYDAWCDCEFVKFGRKVMVGQGATIMSSMVVGNYLIIKEVILDDYVVIGGQDTIAPGTIIGKESVIGALSTTNYGQILEDGFIYFGIPAIKLKKNKYAEESRDQIRIVDVDGKKKYKIAHKVNIDDDKKYLVEKLHEMEDNK